jgi:hypothetical protein
MGTTVPQIPSVQDIQNLVDSYVNCWSTNQRLINVPGRVRGIQNPNLILMNNFGPCEEQFLVFVSANNGIWSWRYQIQSFPFSLTCELPILLTRSLNAQTMNFDHRVLWSWIAQILQDSRNQNPVTDHDLVEAYKLLVRINLASLGQPPMNEEIAKLNQIISTIVSDHVKEMVMHSLELATVLSYPLLERLLKLKCSAFVNLDGDVTTSFSISLRNSPFQVGQRISSLEALLLLFEERVASPATAALLNRFKSEVERIFGSSQQVYSLIYSWRNNMLHGSVLRQANLGVIVNLICLLLLDSIQSNYSSLARNFSQRPSMPGFPDPWQFYPPNLF